MGEHLNGSSGTPGVSRRDLLKRSAVVGGALVWATPVVQSIGGSAMAGTSPGSLPSGTGGGTGCISFIGFVIDCSGTYYGYKVENAFCNDGSQNLVPYTDTTKIGGPSGDKCDSYWQTLTANLTLASDTSLSHVTVDMSSNTISAASGCTFYGWVLHDGGCSSFTGSGPNGKYTSCYSSVPGGTTVDACGVAVGSTSSGSATFNKPCDSCTAP